MPKVPDIHFDVPALVAQVLEQDLGLLVSTNNPGGFRRIIYKFTRANPDQRIHLYTDHESPNRFYLLKLPLEEVDGEGS